MSDKYNLYDSVAKKWYRMFGDSKEYEPDMITTYGMIPASQLEKCNSLLEKSKADRLTADDIAKINGQMYPSGICPFKMLKGYTYRRCDKRCVMMHDYKCSLSSALDVPGMKMETKGKDCPFGGNCSEDCEFNRDGCVLAKVLILNSEVSNG